MREFRWLWIAQVLSFAGDQFAQVGSHRTLGIDAVTFGISAFIVLIAVKPRPTAARIPGKRPTMWSVSADGIRIVFGNPHCGRCCRSAGSPGSTFFPRGVAAPYAHLLGGTAVTVGLLMAAIPLGTVADGLLLQRRRADGGEPGRPAWPVRGSPADHELGSASHRGPRQLAAVTARAARRRHGRRLLTNDSRIEPSSPSSGRIAHAIRYSRMPSP